MNPRVALTVIAMVFGFTALAPVPNSQVARAATVDPTYLIMSFYDSVFRGDVEGAMAVWTDDAVITGRALCPVATPCKGKEAIRLEVVRAAGDRTHNTLINIAVSPGKVETREEMRSAATSSSGVERRIVFNTWEIRGDKISANEFREDTSGSDPQSVIFANFVRVNRIAIAVRTGLNNGNVAGLLALITDDAVFEGLGLCTPDPCRGKAAIQKEFERLVADRTQQSAALPDSQRGAGNTVTARHELRSDSIRAAGAERAIFTLTTEVTGERVSALRVALDRTDPQTATFLGRGSVVRPPSTGDGGLR